MEFLNTLLNDPVVVSLSRTLLHFCWQGALIAAVLYLFLNTVDKKHAELRYLGAISAMVLFLVVPLFTFGHFYGAEVTSANALPVTNVYLQDALVNINEIDFETFLPLAALIWLAGVLSLSFQLSVEMFQVYQLPKKQSFPVEQHVQHVFDTMARKLKVTKKVRLLASARAEVPMVIGVVRPVVLVPVSMISGLSVAQLEMLFAHELGHIKRHDFLVNLLQTLVEVLFFFHPAVKWVSRQVRIEREYCCDDIAVKCCGNAHDYARTLADAESIRKAAIPELVMAATGGDLKGRVVRMVKQNDCSDNFSHSWHSLALAGVIAVSFATLSFYAQDGLQARFADTLGRDIPDNSLFPDPEPSSRVEVAMNEGPAINLSLDDVASVPATQNDDMSPPQLSSGTRDRATELVAMNEMQRETSTMVVSASESVNDQADMLASVEAANLETRAPLSASEPAEAVLVVSNQTLPQTSQGIVIDELASSAADIVEDRGILANTDFIEETQFTAVENQPEARPDIEIEGFRPSSSALKVSLAKLNEKLQSDGFALSIESDRIAMAVEPETLNVPTIIAPRLIRSAPPKYPRMAVSKGIEADVVVTFTVNSRGRVEDLNFENKVQGYFKRSVRQALNSWRFEPGSIDGETAKMSMQKVFSFSDPDNYANNAGSLKLTGSRIAKDI